MGQPMYMQKAVNSGGTAQTPNANRDGTGDLTEIVTCSAPAGLRIDSIHFQAVDTTVANVLRVYLSNESEVVTRLIKEIPVTAVTVSNTVPAWAYDWELRIPLILENGYSLLFAPSTGSARYHVSVTSGGEL